jgi:hypothetical protein
VVVGVLVVGVLVVRVVVRALRRAEPVLVAR